MKQYDVEQTELETKMNAIKSALAEEREKSGDIKQFIALIRKCKNPTEISDLMFYELIDKTVVYEAEGVNRARTQKVDIYFNYVGQVNIDYTPEEVAEIQAQEAQTAAERLQKQRAREKAYWEKRKTERLAANGGELVKKQVCPQCGKIFIPASSHQTFCSEGCCHQARQDQKKQHRCTVDCALTCVARDCAVVVAGFVLNLLYGICGSIGMILAGLGGFAAFLALLDGSYAQAAASALVALLLCPFAAPMLLSLAGSALIIAASALFAWLF